MGFEKLLFHKHLEKGELILFAIHEHWILLVKPGLTIGFFGLLLPWLLYSIGLNTAAFFWIAVIWSIGAYILFMYKLFDWYADAILVTSGGLLKINWEGFFSNTASRVTYEEVEGAGYEIKGFWPTVLRYGQFTVRFISGNSFVLKHASRPARAELKVMELCERYMHSKNQKDVAGLKSLLSDLATYHLRKKN